MNIPNQTRRNILIFTLIILALAWGVIYLFLNYQLKSSIDRQFQSVAASAQRLFEIDLEQSKKELNIELDKMVARNDLSKAVNDGDYEEIKSIVLPFYDRLKNEYATLNILTFRSPDGITLFRAHKPEYFGDA
ncbi:MAG: GGDEF domain-containing protein, partial [Sulfurimonas sp.]|nr:GGDEF domain-containing protein [Sulfurimonas sp.]